MKTTKLEDFFLKLGYDITGLKNGFLRVNQYLGWYKGFVDEFHRYYIYNGERKINMVRSFLQVAKKYVKILQDF